MIQGTGSGVGKSLVVTGLCRLLRRRGVDVAPFKAQNMSNNAAVTARGGEIGRAQHLQAIAAGVEPSVEMNPILLKPLGDRQSEVVALGSGRPDLTNTPWRERSPHLAAIAFEALDDLRQRHDLIVIEGAGSPAEINLRPGDFVNMGLAREIDAPVILVADIDTGGAFAALYGTWGLLEPEDRQLIRGFVLNKFRGDPALLAPAPAILESLTGIPVIGVVPRVHHLLPEEDGAGEAFALTDEETEVRIGAIALPHASNIDDFDPLRAEPGVQVVKVTHPGELWRLDAVVLPGTRNTVADMAWLRRTGLADGIRGLAKAGTPVVGLCGGYQMLGQTIEDPTGVEGDAASPVTEGLGLLPIRTRYATRKETRRVPNALVESGAHLFGELAGDLLAGYEIHHGSSLPAEGVRPWLTRDGHGIGHCEGSAWGCYLHDLFANDEVRRVWLTSLGAMPSGEGWHPRLEIEIDRWADVLEECLDVDALLAQVI